MTRRELAKHLSKDVTKKGLHYQHGTTVYQTIEGDWGAFVGLQRPPHNTLWFEHVGWDKVTERNTVLKIERELRTLEIRYTGRAKRIKHN